MEEVAIPVHDSILHCVDGPVWLIHSPVEGFLICFQFGVGTE